MSESTYEIELVHDGTWPTTWKWSVTRRPDWNYRVGWTFTKERARRKAIKAKQSMERDDVRTVMEA